MNLPQAVITAITLLNESGYEAYVVGGAVRSALLNQSIHDYDITTSALPNETISVFRDYKVVETGIKHGTVTVFIDHMPLEITTYRIEQNYKDHRHPDTVVFSQSLKEDCQRRDFTMNALCYHPKHGIIDFFQGVEDIQNKTIRCVGNPDTRFEEDALRILRAIRFSAQLGFSIEEKTACAILSHAADLKYVAIERINDEFTKCMAAPYFSKVIQPCISIFDQFFPFQLYDESQLQQVIEYTETNTDSAVVTMALLLAPLNDIEIARKTCNDLRYSNEFKHDVLSLLQLKDYVVSDIVSLRKLCHRLTVPMIKYVSFVSTLHPEYDSFNILHMHQEMIERGDCYSLKQLAINGQDLIALGITGKQISEMLEDCLNAVIEERIPNIKEDCIAYIKTRL